MTDKPLVNIQYEAPTVPGATESLQKGERIQPKQIKELFPTVSAAPSGRPGSFIEQIQIAYIAPFVYLYIYDEVNNTWLRQQF